MSRGPRSAGAEGDRGRDERGCSILHVDLDAFVASVELARRPQLRGRPVIVGGGSRGVVLAATYEARVFGVQAAMPMSAALRRCPHAVVVAPDHLAYQEVSRAVMRLLRDITALVEPVGVDEAFLDVVGARRRLGPPTVIAQLIRSQVREQLGITCSVGIGSTKLVARLASGQAKPDGVLLVPRSATAGFLRALPVGALAGVGEKTEAALARSGIWTVAQLADSDVSAVQRAVGAIAGAHLHDLAWGRDPRPVRPDRQERSLGAEETFVADVADLSVMQEKARQLADRCAVRLRRNGLVSRTISVHVRTADLRTLTRSRTLVTPTDVGRELFLAARQLLAGVDLAGWPVRRVGVRVEDLSVAPSAIRRPTPDEESEGTFAGRGRERPGSGTPLGRSARRPIRAPEPQRAGVPSHSTTTFVPADLS